MESNTTKTLVFKDGCWQFINMPQNIAASTNTINLSEASLETPEAEK